MPTFQTVKRCFMSAGAAVFETYSIEPDDSLKPKDVWRIVADSARERFTRVHKTTARPPYVATIYSKDMAVHICKLLNAAERGQL